MSRLTKNSSINWLGNIPINWKIIRTRYLCDISTGNKDTVNQEPDGVYPFFVRSQDVKRINTYSFDGEAVLTAGDGDIGKIFHYIDGKFDFHQRVYKFSDFNYVLGKFFYYYASSTFIKELDNYSAKTTVSSIRLPWIKDYPIAIPPIIEQQAIANFLDEKTAKIDELIKLQETAIERLEEYKQSVITETVTKGLDPNVEMKDSNLSFCSIIPINFEEIRFKYVVNVSSGLSISKAEYVQEGIDYLHYGDIHSNLESVLDLREMSMPKIPIKYSSKKKSANLKNGDLVFCDTSEDLEGAGKHLYVKSLAGKEVISGSHTILCRQKANFNPSYMSYLFRGSEVKSEIESRVYGIKVYSMSQSILKDVSIVLPPISVQENIATYLDKKMVSINKLIDSKNVKIQKLNEYKKSLMYEAVTGKIEVM